MSAPVLGPVQLLTAQRRSKYGPTEEQLYICPNGYALAARKGGQLTLGGDDAPWEVVVLDRRTIPAGVTTGPSAGWVTDEQLPRLADLLARAA